MKKLVLVYYVGSFEYSADITLPFEYESVAKAEYDLFELWRYWKARHLRYYSFTRNPYIDFKGNDRDKLEYYKANLPPYPKSDIEFAGMNIDLNDFGFESYNDPKILELEEWFETYKNGQ